MLNHQRFRTVSAESSGTNSLLMHRTNDVVLTEDEWKKNALFHGLITQHALIHRQQQEQVGIDYLATNMIQVWIVKHNGRFFQHSSAMVDGTKALHRMTTMPSIGERVYTILSNAVTSIRGSSLSTISTPGISPTARNMTLPTQVVTISDTAISCVSSDETMEDYLEEISTNDDSPPLDDVEEDLLNLLPFDPQDIFESLDQHLAAHPLSPEKINKPRRVAHNMEPLSENQSFLEKLDLPGPAIQPPSSTGRPLTPPPVLLVPIAIKPPLKGAAPIVKTAPFVETPAVKTPIIARKRCAGSSLPLRKRFRKTKELSFDTDKVTPTPAAALPKVVNLEYEYTPGDVVFAGKSVRNHNGNQLLADTIWRFTKTNHGGGDGDIDVPVMATHIISLWNEFECRFLEASSKDVNSSHWVDVEPTVLHRRISIMIQESLKARKEGKLSLASKRTHKNQVQTKMSRRKIKDASPRYQVQVPILHVNVEKCTIGRHQDSVLIDTIDKIEELSENDLLLGDSFDHQMPLGNLKFLHHMDSELQLKFERAKSTAGKLDVIRKLVASWKKRCHLNWKKGDGRFFAPGSESSQIVYSSTRDELTISLYVLRMLKHHLPPVPAGMAGEVFLGDCWTVQRSHKRNHEYCEQVTNSIRSYKALVSDADKKTHSSEMITSLIGDIILKSFGDNALSKERFRLFDRRSKTWKVISFNEARQRTLMTLRLKTYFGGHCMTVFKFVESKGNPSPIKPVVARRVTSSHATDDDVNMAASPLKPTPLLQMQNTAAPLRTTFGGRTGAKSPVPSDLQSEVRSPSPDRTFALLEELLLSPDSSNPEKEAALLQAGIMSPNISPTKTFIHKIPTFSQLGQGPMTFMQLLARRPAHVQPRAAACFLPDGATSNVFQPNSMLQLSSMFQPSPASWGSLGGLHHHHLMSQASNPTNVQTAHHTLLNSNGLLNVVLFPQHERQRMQQPNILPRPVARTAWVPSVVPHSTNQQPSNNNWI